MIKIFRFGKKEWVNPNRRETRRRKQLNRTRRTRPGSSRPCSLHLFNKIAGNTNDWSNNEEPEKVGGISEG